MILRRLTILATSVMLVGCPMNSGPSPDAGPVEPFNCGGRCDCITGVELGGDFTCVTKSDNSVYCFGENGHGQLGDGNLTERDSPTRVSLLGEVVHLSTGNQASCAVKADQSLWCWGFAPGESFELGPPGSAFQPIPTPEQVLSGELVQQVAAGNSHHCAIVDGGRVRCFGKGSFATGSAGVVQVAGVGELTGAVEIAVGRLHSCARLDDQSVWCWGTNSNGAFGTGTEDAGSSFAVETLFEGSQLALASLASCVLAPEGQVECAGWDGLVGGVLTATPSPVPDAPAAAYVDAGHQHQCLIDADGQVHCWGVNESGGLGDGTTEHRVSPVVVSLPGPASAVSAGRSHTCALLTSGALYCWGSNASGQLGDGTRERRLRPVEARVRCP